MGKALYRKYRSKKLSEIVGQEHITRTLENALKTGKISHAYLFTGPRGVGKTSIARILAHEINGLPYTDESTHLDIIEIDAASNRRIDEIRDLRDKVHIAPTSSKYKVYIIDEVHMLTKEAFNALLKTLEEPPAHVVFILATTELHKLPETIVSRTQRFSFKAIEPADATRHLAEIAKSEGIDIDEGALELLALQGGGSFRDSISLLDQVSGLGGKIARTDAERMVGLASSERITTLLEAIRSGNPAGVLSALDGLAADGATPGQAARQLSAVIRREILEGRADSAASHLLGELLEVNVSANPAGKLEVVLLGAALGAVKAAPVQKVTEPEKVSPVEEPSQAKDQAPAIEPAKPAAEPEAEVAVAKAVGTPADWWQDVLKEIKSINNTLYGAMRMAEPLIDGDDLHLNFKFKLHAKKATEPEVLAKLHDAITKVTGQRFKINAIVNKNPVAIVQPAAVSTSSPDTAPDNNPHLDSVKNIFGGGEVLD